MFTAFLPLTQWTITFYTESLVVRVVATLVLETHDHESLLEKGKSVCDFAGILPNTGMTVDEMREKAIEEGVKEDGLTVPVAPHTPSSK
jgi:hypothetical protein